MAPEPINLIGFCAEMNTQSFENLWKTTGIWKKNRAFEYTLENFQKVEKRAKKYEKRC